MIADLIRRNDVLRAGIKEAQDRHKADIGKIRDRDAEIARLRNVLEYLADEDYWRDQIIIRGAFTASAMIDMASSALSTSLSPDIYTCEYIGGDDGKTHENSVEVPE